MSGKGGTQMTAAETGTLTQEEREALAELAFTLGAKYANRRLNDLDAARDHWAEVCAAGLSACSLPAQYGGAGGMSELLLVAERLAAGGYPAGKLTLSTAVAGAIIARHGTGEQKGLWLPAIGGGSLRFCFALTEPGAGSNSARMKTMVSRTSQGWLINGQRPTSRRQTIPMSCS